MANLRPPKVEHVAGMPDHLLKWRDYIDESQPAPDYADPEFWHMAEARRSWRAARVEYLKGVRERPHGVAALEFLTAHGFTWERRESAKKAGLTF